MKSSHLRKSFLFLLLAGIAAGAAQAQTACLSIQRTVSGCAISGSNVDVTVTIQSGCAEEISALGLRETIPDGWTYQD